ncbi:MAG: DNA-binding domain-containing protein, partial [Pseudomonadota bacterium]
FNIYRNNRVVSLIDSLRSIYPALHKLLGEDFFKASARAFIESQPPTQPVMAEYGRHFGAFVATLPGVEKYPFLSDVAQLDWSYLQAFHSEDAPVLDITALSTLPPESVMQVQICCHPALHIVESPWPAGTIWNNSLHQSQPSSHTPDMQRGEAVVITRPELQVQVNIVDSAEAVFLRKLQSGETLAAAAEKALEFDTTFDAGAALIGLIGLGAFSRFANPNH